jgi:Fur family ferric uptake transcriptional regulator
VQKAIDILAVHQLKKTKMRMQVIDLLKEAPYAVTHTDIEERLGEQTDRVTLYRILKKFEEKGILHKVFDRDGTSRYALCNDACNDHKHVDNHLHFQCLQCGNVFCLDMEEMPQINLPKGFKLNTLKFTAEGKCKNC